jgi:hypothetical protein
MTMKKPGRKNALALLWRPTPITGLGVEKVLIVKG